MNSYRIKQTFGERGKRKNTRQKFVEMSSFPEEKTGEEREKKPN